MTNITTLPVGDNRPKTPPNIDMSELLAAKDAEIAALKAGVQEALLVLEGERDTTLKALYDTTSTLETVIGTLQTERAWMRYAFAALRGLVDAGIITDAPVLAMAPSWLQDEPAPVVVEDAPEALGRGEDAPG